MKLIVVDNTIADTKFYWADIGLSPAHSICDVQEEGSIWKRADGDPGPGERKHGECDGDGRVRLPRGQGER